ncbi:MAG: ABC transporter permease subunit [Rubricoccaceae bacterium]
MPGPTFSTVARYEAYRAARDLAMWVALVLVAVAFAVAAWTGRAETTRQYAEAEAVAAREALAFAERRAAAVEAERALAAGEDVPSAGPRGPLSAWGLGRGAGVRIALPPAPLVGLAVGQSDLVPAEVHVTTASPAAAAPEARPANPLSLLIGGFDAAFVVLVFLPLALLVATYDLLSGDRERGTLRLLLAGPLTASQLARARALVRGGSVLAAALVGLTGVWLFASGGESPARFGLFALAAALYGVFWIALAVFVDARSRSAAANAAALAGAWLGLVVVVPALVHTAASALVPAPERAALVAAQRTAAAEARRETQATMDRFFAAHPELARAPREGDPPFHLASLARDEAIAQAVDLLAAEARTAAEARARTLGALRFTSPTLLAHDALLDAAGTGHARRTYLGTQTDAFQERWAAFFRSRIVQGDNAWTVADFDDVPRAALSEEPAVRAARRVVLPLSALAVLALSLGLLAAARLRAFSPF